MFPLSHHIRVCLCHLHLHRFRFAIRNYLQALQLLARCSSARQLLLLRAFSLSAIAHDLAAAGSFAVSARRPCMEALEAQGTSIRASPISPGTRLFYPVLGQALAPLQSQDGWRGHESGKSIPRHFRRAPTCAVHPECCACLSSFLINVLESAGFLL